MSIYSWIRLIAVFTVLVGVLSVGVASPEPVEAKATVITVPGGDVVALYAAVYKSGKPRNNVEINLEPGVYVLDPSKPFGGRLILGL